MYLIEDDYCKNLKISSEHLFDMLKNYAYSDSLSDNNDTVSISDVNNALSSELCGDSCIYSDECSSIYGSDLCIKSRILKKLV